MMIVDSAASTSSTSSSRGGASIAAATCDFFHPSAGVVANGPPLKPASYYAATAPYAVYNTGKLFLL